jgi:hypothetical protein
MSVRRVTAAALTVATVAGAAAAYAGPVRRAPSRLLVSGTEFDLVLSRGAVRRGPAVIQFLNRGEDPHDLHLQRAGAVATRTVRVPEVRPGQLVEFETRLRSGRYRLWCSLPGHEERGMRATLRVRRAR